MNTIFELFGAFASFLYQFLVTILNFFISILSLTLDFVRNIFSFL